VLLPRGCHRSNPPEPEAKPELISAIPGIFSQGPNPGCLPVPGNAAGGRGDCRFSEPDDKNREVHAVHVIGDQAVGGAYRAKIRAEIAETMRARGTTRTIITKMPGSGLVMPK
jgi:hypothetical protein